MARFIILLLFTTLAFAQTSESTIPDLPIMPFGYKLEKGFQVVAFVDQKCSVCPTLINDLSGLQVTLISKNKLSKIYSNTQLVDTSGLLHEIFPIRQFPTVVVVKDGIARQQFAFGVRTKDIRNLKIDTMSSSLPLLKFSIGDQVTGKFSNHTGAITFWRSSCASCQREKPALTRMCSKKVNPLVVFATRQEPELIPKGCNGGYGRDYALELGVPVVPATLFFKSGKLIWYKLGYFARLERVIEILAAVK